jgi:phosphohistidine swiveling domain-containing protein
VIDHEGHLHILQSRPITTLSYRVDVPELTNADLKDGGISARVCTPFMFSAYRNALQFSMGDYFKRIHLIKNPEDITWIYMFYGKVYWNAGAVKEGLRSIPGFNEQDFDRDLGIQKDYGDKGPSKTPLNLSTLTNAIPVMIGLYKEFQDCEIMVDQFRNQFELKDQFLKKKICQLKDFSNEEFFKWFNDVITFQIQTERNYFRTIYNNSNFQTEFKTKLKKVKSYREGDEIDLMSSIEGVTHLSVQDDLEILAKDAQNYGLESLAYHQSRENFLIKHYHHGPAELDLTVPRWGERKDWVDDLVRSFQFRDKKYHSTFQDSLSRLTSSMGYLAKKSFIKALNRSRHFLKIREEMRSYSTRAYYLLRLGLLDFSRRLNIKEIDVFMYDINEIIHYLNSKNKSLPDTEERFLHYQGYRSFVAPNEFGGQIVQTQNSYTEGSLQGIGCSSGEKIGYARVILDIHQTLHLSKDDILVTRFTDPGWTPVLARVGGVVTEVGGLLSHAAVIGREYGIPAILNLNHATSLIKDGSRIKINGKTGVVELLEEGS